MPCRREREVREGNEARSTAALKPKLSSRQLDWLQHETDVANDLIFAAQKLRTDVVNSMTAPGPGLAFLVTPSGAALRNRIVLWQRKVWNELKNAGMDALAYEFLDGPPILHSELTLAACDRFAQYVDERKRILERLLAQAG